MMKVYKLVIKCDGSDGKEGGGEYMSGYDYDKPTRWELGKEMPRLAGNKGLCTDAWYHVYLSAEAAAYFRDIHVDSVYNALLECEVDEAGLRFEVDKCGVATCLPCREVEMLPTIYKGHNADAMFNILIKCGLAINDDDPDYARWAELQLSADKREWKTDAWNELWDLEQKMAKMVMRGGWRAGIVCAGVLGEFAAYDILNWFGDLLDMEFMMTSFPKIVREVMGWAEPADGGNCGPVS